MKTCRERERGAGCVYFQTWIDGWMNREEERRRREREGGREEGCSLLAGVVTHWEIVIIHHANEAQGALRTEGHTQ